MFTIGAHKWIQRFCGDSQQPECPIDEILSFPKRRSCTISDGIEMDSEIDNKESYLSLQLDQLLAKFKLKRIETQVKIANPTGSYFSDVAPIVDVLCVDKKGRPVPIEIKTGRVRRIRKKNKNDRGANGKLHEFADTFALRHHAQLSVQIECLRNVKWNGAGTGYLVYVDPLKVRKREPLHLKLIRINKDVLKAIRSA